MTQPQLSQNFLLRGVIPSAHLPSDALLSVELNVTGLFTEGGADYVAWKQGLEDRLNGMDRKYAKVLTRLRGRKVSAAYKTMTEQVVEGEGDKAKVKSVKVRGRIIQLMPYPSKFSNTIGDLRTDFYGAQGTRGLLKTHNAVLLSSSSIGRRRFAANRICSRACG